MRIIIAELIWDMVRAKIMPILTFFVAFSILSCASFALKTVDAQADTHCTATECWTSVNLEKHLSTTDISTAKSLDLKSKLPAIKGIENMDIKNIENVLNISGKIALGSSQYWTLDIPELSLSIDPYWNSTVSNVSTWTGPDQPNTQVQSRLDGIKIHTKKACHLDSVTVDNDVVANYVYVYKTDNSLVAKESISAGTATFNVNLLNDTDYYVVAGSDCSATTRAFLNPFASNYPITTDSNINVVSMAWTDCAGSWTTNEDNINDIYSITTSTSTTTSTYYEFGLKLNDTEGNITASNNTLFNVFAYSNLTNLQINLTRNGTLLDSQIGNITSTQNLTEGLYYFTATSNNSDSVTYWANVINTFENATNETNETNTTNITTIISNASIVFDIASLEPNQRYCFNASMRADVYSEANITRYIVCDYGCESNACNPNPIYVYLGIGAFFIIVLWIATRRKRK